MILEIVEGREAYISAQKIRSNEYFMYPAYHDALLALIDTVKQLRRVREDSELDYSLTNIIAFSAPRGGGKTSTLLSFAEVMEEPDGFRDSGIAGCQALEGIRFQVLPAIVPSVLRDGQSILPVVLSRMYRFAEKEWEKNRRDHSRYPQNRTSEAEKSELLYWFQECLNGINALNSRDDRSMDLARLHEISDGASLRQNFYQLTQQLMKFAGCPDGFLVIKLDDADSQVAQGYEMLEHIRKYLTIPNLIILMATDFDMLRQVVMKHHCDEFQSALDNKLIDYTDLHNLTAKYLDKLIPPLNLVYLPRTEWHSVHRGGDFKIRYLSDQKLIWPKEKKFSFQTDILRQIYLKTGLVFVEHSTYQNNIIPTTLRGLKQLLEILIHMPDIPVVRKQDKQEPNKLADRVEKQAKIAQENLARFYDYFIHDWINVKIKDADDLAFIRNLEKSPASDRLGLIIDYLEKHWSNFLVDHAKDDYSYAAMMQCIETVNQKSRSQRDYLFFFVIRTLLNLESHHRVWIEKFDAAIRYKKEREGLLLFDLSAEKTYLADTYYVANFYNYLSNISFQPSKSNKFDLDFQKEVPLLQVLLGDRGRHLELSYMHLINLFLALGSPQLRKHVLVYEETPANSSMYDEGQQCRLYNAQEAALFIASNWEVQRLLLLNLDVFINIWKDDRLMEAASRAVSRTSQARNFFDHMDYLLIRMNQGSIWNKGEDEGFGEAFRNAANQRIIEGIDLDLFYNDIYSRISKMI